MESTTQPGNEDPVLTWLEANGFPLTRESYAALAMQDGEKESDVEYPEGLED